MTVRRIDRWNIEIAGDSCNVVVPAEASFDGSILSVFLERARLTPEDRAAIRGELERSYAGSGVRLEFDPEL